MNAEEYNNETRKDQAIVDCLRLLDNHLDGMESTHTVRELYNLCLAVREQLAPFALFYERYDI